MLVAGVAVLVDLSGRSRDALVLIVRGLLAAFTRSGLLVCLLLLPRSLSLLGRQGDGVTVFGVGLVGAVSLLLVQNAINGQFCGCRNLCLCNGCAAESEGTGHRNCGQGL